MNLKLLNQVVRKSKINIIYVIQIEKANAYNWLLVSRINLRLALHVPKSMFHGSKALILGCGYRQM